MKIISTGRAKNHAQTSKSESTEGVYWLPTKHTYEKVNANFKLKSNKLFLGQPQLHIQNKKGKRVAPIGFRALLQY